MIARLRLQERGSQTSFGAELEFVGARAGHRIDHAAGGAAELDRIAAGLDLEFLVESERHRGEAVAVVEVGDVEAIDVDGVLGHGRAAEGDAAEAVALDQAGRQQRDRRDVTLHRQALQAPRG